MILRKPYAFLIKHFNLIHIILFILMSVFYHKMSVIVDYLTEYISKGTYHQEFKLVEEYIGVAGFLIPIVIIVIDLVVIYLLRLKDKPTRYYWFTILTYVIEIIAMGVAYYTLTMIQMGKATSAFIPIFNDFFSAFRYLQIPFMVVALARAVGFNIKQFNFKKDLLDLEIVEEDNEEFEFEVDVDTDDIKTKINKKIRFIKYIYLENKIIFIILAMVILLGAGFGIYKFISSEEKIYSEEEIFYAYQLELKIEDSYKTEYAINRSTIKENYFYVIVNLNYKSDLDIDTVLPYENIYLRVNDEKRYSPIDNYKRELSDFGERYISDSKVKSKENKTVSIVYEVENKYSNNDMVLEYLNRKTGEGNTIEYQYTKISLEPKQVDDSKCVDEKKLGETLEFKDSFIDGTSLTIKEIDFNRKHTYYQKVMIEGQEREFEKIIIPTSEGTYKKTIMRLSVDIKNNDELNKLVYSKFFENFAIVEYEIDGKIERTRVIDLTPINATTNYTYLEVRENVTQAEEIYIVFTIRDKEYRYLIVDKTQDAIENKQG